MFRPFYFLFYVHSLFLFLAFLVQSQIFRRTVSNFDFYRDSTAAQKVLVLTAHPDDECLFFAPTIQALSRAERGTMGSDPLNDRFLAPVQLYTLCLSTGDADGLGNIRREELDRSLGVLGVASNSRRVLDHPDLQDNITAMWNPATIAEVVYPFVNEHKITTILTFDEGGVSGHPNHRSLPEGVKHMLMHSGHALSVPPPKLFTLTTHPITTKYLGIAAPVFSGLNTIRKTVVFSAIRALRLDRIFPEKLGPNTDNPPVITSGYLGYFKALNAMRQHHSQLVWFRWLYVMFSRYMWINVWVEVQVDAAV